MIPGKVFRKTYQYRGVKSAMFFSVNNTFDSQPVVPHLLRFYSCTLVSVNLEMNNLAFINISPKGGKLFHFVEAVLNLEFYTICSS